MQVWLPETHGFPRTRKTPLIYRVAESLRFRLVVLFTVAVGVTVAAVTWAGLR